VNKFDFSQVIFFQHVLRTAQVRKDEMNIVAEAKSQLFDKEK
jgi:hypothetical protein